MIDKHKTNMNINKFIIMGVTAVASLTPLFSNAMAISAAHVATIGHTIQASPVAQVAEKVINPENMNAVQLYFNNNPGMAFAAFGTLVGTALTAVTMIALNSVEQSYENQNSEPHMNIKERIEAFRENLNNNKTSCLSKKL